MLRLTHQAFTFALNIESSFEASNHQPYLCRLENWFYQLWRPLIRRISVYHCQASLLSRRDREIDQSPAQLCLSCCALFT